MKKSKSLKDLLLIARGISPSCCSKDSFSSCCNREDKKSKETNIKIKTCCKRT